MTNREKGKNKIRSKFPMLGVAVPPTAAAGRRVADPCIIAKAAVNVFLRTAALLFYSLLCAECGSPKPLKKGLSDSDAESVFFTPKLYKGTASG